MVTILTDVERWQRRCHIRSFFSRFFLVFLWAAAAAGLMPWLRSYWQDPAEINVWLCAAGVIVTLTSVTIIGIFSGRRVRSCRR